MSELSPALIHAVENSSECVQTASHLSALLQSYPPPFIFVHDPENPRLTASGIRASLQGLVTGRSDLVRLKCAHVNALACFSPRILFDTALNAFAGWTPDWQGGAPNWPGIEGAEVRRYNENFDAFVHGLQAVYANAFVGSGRRSDMGKGKERASETACPPPRLVLMVERAERLPPELLVPLTRLAELSQIDIVTVFVADVQWQDIRPPLRASPEPYYIDVAALSTQATQDLLTSCYDEASTSRLVDPQYYHPALKPLYAHFINTLYGSCSLFTHDPLELAYIAAARWPGFVRPVIDAYQQDVGTRDEDDANPELTPPTEDIRLRLTRLFTPSLTAALEVLHPRLDNAAHWAHTHAPPSQLLELPPGRAPDALLAHAALLAQRRDATAAAGVSDASVDALPRMAKFILVAAFLASTNAPRSDVRMFGRGPDERAKRRRRGGTPRKPKPGVATVAAKVPQRLLGPLAFPLDRMIAILGVLLEENDAETRLPAPQYGLPGEYTEMEIARTALHANISELASMRLLVRTSPVERLDGVPTFKCGIGYDLAVKLARSIGIVLNDLMYEVV